MLPARPMKSPNPYEAARTVVADAGNGTTLIPIPFSAITVIVRQQELHSHK